MPRKCVQRQAASAGDVGTGEGPGEGLPHAGHPAHAEQTAAHPRAQQQTPAPEHPAAQEVGHRLNCRTPRAPNA